MALTLANVQKRADELDFDAFETNSVVESAPGGVREGAVEHAM